jgi:hypothetical protein
MELLECDLEKQAKSGITETKYVLTLKYYNEFTRAVHRY